MGTGNFGMELIKNSVMGIDKKKQAQIFRDLTFNMDLSVKPRNNNSLRG